MAGLSLGVAAIAKVALGTVEIAKISLGDTLVWQAVTFLASGMTKSGSTTFLNTETIVNGFAADTGSYPGSEVVGGTTLLVRGAKAGATVAASVVGDGSSPSRQFRASLRLNGTEIASASGSNTSTLSLSAQADVVESDQITLFVWRTSGSGFASVGTGTWVRVT